MMRFAAPPSKSPQTLSLRTLLIVPFVAQIFVAVGLTGYISYRNGQESVNEVAAQLRHETTDRIQDQLRTYLNTPLTINRLNVDAARFSSLNLKDVKGMTSHFWQQLNAFELVSIIYMGNEQGEYMGASREGKEITVNVVNSSTQNRHYAYRPDPQGHPAQLIQEPHRVYDPRKRPWYIATRSAQRPTWSPIYTFFSPPSLGITASHPLYSSDRQLTAIFATDLSLSAISEFLNSLTVGKTGQSFILERSSGIMIGTSTRDLPYRLNNKQEPETITGEQSSNPITRATTQQLLQQFGSLKQINEPQQLNFVTDHQRLFVEVAPIKDGNGIDWLTVVVIPEADFMAQIHANARTTVLLCLATLGLTTLAGILISRRIIRPVEELNTASQAIANGELDRQVTQAGIDELDTLGESFNQMAHQLKESFTQLEQVNEALENRVDQRTAELKAANEEITGLNRRLQADNLRMSAELEVTRQLQQMILPKEEELMQIRELDIAGFMEPALEVGGDYYDVMHQDGKVQIGIGDVTGHGLESGVLMIMAQTAVRTLLANGETDRTKLLSAVNRMIYDNTRRMDSCKNMTLALLEYEAGVLRLSGQHEELVIVRREGQVESIDTIDLGFPLGLTSDITPYIAEATANLHSGDVAVLYTDGIVEATNSQNQLYGLERLHRVLQQNREQGARDIREAVIEDVMRHIGKQKVFDDLTLVVLKRI